MEHVLKTTKKNYYGRLTTQTSHRKESWASTATVLRTTRLWLKARHDSNWLEDCVLEGQHHREVNRSQTWPTKATWARTNAGVFMSDPGLKSHGCWIQKVALSGGRNTGGTIASVNQ